MSHPAASVGGSASPATQHGSLVVNSGNGALGSPNVHSLTISPIIVARWLLVQKQRLEALATSLENHHPGILATAGGQQQTDQNVDVDMPDVGSELDIDRAARQFIHDVGIDPDRLVAGTELARFLEWAAGVWVSGGGPMEGVASHQ